MSELREQLSERPIGELAKWICELNCFRWPDDFPETKPDGYDGMSDRARYKNKKMRHVMLMLFSFVPIKERVRAWHIGGYCGEPKTNEEFESWWEVNCSVLT